MAMEIILRIPVLTQKTGTDHFTAEGETLGELLDHIEAAYPGFQDVALEDGKLAGFLQVYVKKKSDKSLIPVHEMDAHLGRVVEVLFLPVVCGG